MSKRYFQKDTVAQKEVYIKRKKKKSIFNKKSCNGNVSMSVIVKWLNVQ